MTKRDVLSMALRILGVLGVYWILASLPGSLIAIASVKAWASQSGPLQTNPAAYVISLILHQILMILVTYVLLFHADAISEKLIRDESSTSAPSIRMSETSVLTLAIRIIGVYQLAKGIPDLSSIVAQSMQRTTTFSDSFSRLFRIEHSVEAVATVVLGLVLLLSAKYIADWVCSIGWEEEAASSRD